MASPCQASKEEDLRNHGATPENKAHKKIGGYLQPQDIGGDLAPAGVGPPEHCTHCNSSND